MRARLIGPVAAVARIAERFGRSWPLMVSREVAGVSAVPMEENLRPVVSTSAAVERMGFGAWRAWRTAWADEGRIDGAGIELMTTDFGVRGVSGTFPTMLRVTGLHPTIELLARFGHDALSARVIRAHDIGLRMFEAGAETHPAAIRALERLSDEDVVVALDAVVWLRTHIDLSGWTSRQLPIPGADTKWADSHDTLIRRLTRRRVGEETRERPAVVHLSYADPYYIASGGRRHDAWTAGDSHRLAYEPRIVLVVENRDCRLGFPEFAGTVVVEGEGKAAAKLAEIDWLVRAERILYWGDMDADGFGILNNLRGALEERGAAVESLLMDGTAWGRYKHFGVDRDKDGKRLRPSSIRLPALTPDEEYCYALLATSGEVAVRRIEQERIPLADAAEALRAALGG